MAYLYLLFPKGRKLYLLILFSILCASLQAQQRVITGTIMDENGEVVPGASIVVKGTTNGTISGGDGTFSLSAASQDILVVSFIGYNSQEVVLSDGQTTIKVTLVEDIQQLGEIIVVGYGEVEKSLVTGAISSIKAEELATYSAGQVQQSIQGRVSGVTILPNSGSPGAGFKVRIRGTGSNGNSDPLYIVDGLRTSNIDFLDPFEIASIEILKDAASAAIYGAEGANGVVVVSTKSGEKEGFNITYNMQYGSQSINSRLELMNAQEHNNYLREAGESFRTVDGNGTDWLEESLTNAPLQRHSLFINGGNEKSTYFFGGSFFDQEGIVGGDRASFQRTNLRLNASHNLNDWLKVGHNFSFIGTKKTTLAEDNEFGGILSSILLFDPLTPVTYTGAIPGFVQDLLDAGRPLIRDPNGDIYGLSDFVNGEIVNPLANMDITNGETVTNRVFGTIYTEISPIDKITFTSRLGLNASFGNFHGWSPTFYFTPTRQSNASSATDNNFRSFFWQWENFATYSDEINRHKFSVLLGTSLIEGLGGTTRASYGPLFREQEALSYLSPNVIDGSLSGGFNRGNLLSYFGRVSYDFDSRYLFNATLRYDGTSILPSDNRWGFFPSVSAGWVISNESFFNVNVMDYLKVRASWGQNGSLSNLTPGLFSAGISAAGIQYPDANGVLRPGAEPLNLANPELTWETSEQIDIGLDFGFFNDNLSFTVDYFNKTTKDLLVPGTPPDFVGNFPTIINGGTVRNTGVELELAYRNSTSSGWDFDISGNATFLKNEATFVDGDVVDGANVGTGGYTATFFEEGQPLWYFSGYKTDGIFQNQAQIDQYLSSEEITGYTPSPGDPIVVDVNGDNTISPADHTFIGSPHPDMLFGMRGRVEHKGFDLTVFVQGSIGNDVLLGFTRIDRVTANRPKFFYEDRWIGENSTNEWFKANTSSPFIYNSDLMVFDASFARVKQIQLGYTIPKPTMESIGFTNARIYLSLDDFFTITGYKGVDPEAGSGNDRSQGIDRGLFPLSRKILGGVSITF